MIFICMEVLESVLVLSPKYDEGLTSKIKSYHAVVRIIGDSSKEIIRQTV